MADTLGSAVLRIEVHLGNAITSIDKVNKTLNKMQRISKSMNKHLKTIGTSIDNLGRQSSSSSKQLHSLSQAASSAAKGFNQFTLAGRYVARFAKQVGVSNKSVLNFIKTSGKAANAVATFGVSALKSKSQLGQFQSSLRMSGRHLQMLSRRIALAGAAILAAFIPIVLEGSKFEKTMSAVRAVVEPTAEMFDKLSVKAQKLGASTIFTASEVADAMRFLGLGGLKAQQVYEGVGATLELAAAGGISLSEAADTTINSLNAFRLRAVDLTRVADALAAAQANTNTTIRQAAEALKYATPSAAALGQTIEDTVTVIGALANTGMRASIAGSGLNRMLNVLTGQAKKATEVIRKYGLTYDDINPQIKSVVDIINTFRKVSLSAGDASKLFGMRASRAVNALMNISAEAMARIRDSIENSFGDALEQSTIRIDNFAGKIVEFKSRVQSIFIGIFNSFKNPLTDFIANVNDTLESISDFIGRNKALVASLAQVVAIVGVSLLALAALTAALGLAATVAAVFVGALAAAGITMGAFAAAFAGGIAAITGLAAAISLALMPVIGYMIADFQSGNSVIVEFFSNFMDGVRDAITAGKSWGEYFTDLSDKFKQIRESNALLGEIFGKSGEEGSNFAKVLGKIAGAMLEVYEVGLKLGIYAAGGAARKVAQKKEIEDLFLYLAVQAKLAKQKIEVTKEALAAGEISPGEAEKRIEEETKKIEDSLKKRRQIIRDIGRSQEPSKIPFYKGVTAYKYAGLFSEEDAAAARKLTDEQIASLESLDEVITTTTEAEDALSDEQKKANDIARDFLTTHSRVAAEYQNVAKKAQTFTSVLETQGKILPLQKIELAKIADELNKGSLTKQDLIDITKKHIDQIELEIAQHEKAKAGIQGEGEAALFLRQEFDHVIARLEKAKTSLEENLKSVDNLAGSTKILTEEQYKAAKADAERIKTLTKGEEALKSMEKAEKSYTDSLEKLRNTRISGYASELRAIDEQTAKTLEALDVQKAGIEDALAAQRNLVEFQVKDLAGIESRITALNAEIANLRVNTANLNADQQKARLANAKHSLEIAQQEFASAKDKFKADTQRLKDLADLKEQLATRDAEVTKATAEAKARVFAQNEKRITSQILSDQIARARATKNYFQLAALEEKKFRQDRAEELAKIDEEIEATHDAAEKERLKKLKEQYKNETDLRAQLIRKEILEQDKRKEGEKDIGKIEDQAAKRLASRVNSIKQLIILFAVLLRLRKTEEKEARKAQLAYIRAQTQYQKVLAGGDAGLANAARMKMLFQAAVFQKRLSAAGLSPQAMAPGAGPVGGAGGGGFAGIQTLINMFKPAGDATVSIRGAIPDKAGKNPLPILPANQAPVGPAVRVIPQVPMGAQKPADIAQAVADHLAGRGAPARAAAGGAGRRAGGIAGGANVVPGIPHAARARRTEVARHARARTHAVRAAQRSRPRGKYATPGLEKTTAGGFEETAMGYRRLPRMSDTEWLDRYEHSRRVIKAAKAKRDQRRFEIGDRVRAGIEQRKKAQKEAHDRLEKTKHDMAIGAAKKKAAEEARLRASVTTQTPEEKKAKDARIKQIDEVMKEFEIRAKKERERLEGQQESNKLDREYSENAAVSVKDFRFDYEKSVQTLRRTQQAFQHAQGQLARAKAHGKPLGMLQDKVRNARLDYKRADKSYVEAKKWYERALSDAADASSDVDYASGGVVTKATRALIGEAGPEAVIPLSKLGSAVMATLSQMSIPNLGRFVPRQAGGGFAGAYAGRGGGSTLTDNRNISVEVNNNFDAENAKRILAQVFSSAMS